MGRLLSLPRQRRLLPAPAAGRQPAGVVREAAAVTAPAVDANQMLAFISQAVLAIANQLNVALPAPLPMWLASLSNLPRPSRPSEVVAEAAEVSVAPHVGWLVG